MVISYNFFVKFYGKNIWEPQHDGVLVIKVCDEENVRYQRNMELFSFVWFDSLSPINNFSVKQGQVFLGWTSTKLR